MFRTKEHLFFKNRFEIKKDTTITLNINNI